MLQSSFRVRPLLNLTQRNWNSRVSRGSICVAPGEASIGTWQFRLTRRSAGLEGHSVGASYSVGCFQRAFQHGRTH
jgi:hypothetical protein